MVSLVEEEDWILCKSEDGFTGSRSDIFTIYTIGNQNDECNAFITCICYHNVPEPARNNRVGGY